MDPAQQHKVLQFDSNRRKPVTQPITPPAHGGKLAFLYPPQVYAETYTFRDNVQDLEIIVRRNHAESPFDKELPDEAWDSRDFHGGTGQLEIVIPTDMEFADIVEGYVKQYGPIMPLLFNEEGTWYHHEVDERLRAGLPRNLYSTGVENAKEYGGVASDKFTLEEFLEKKPEGTYGIAYDGKRDVALEFQKFAESSVWELGVYRRRFSTDFFLFLLDFSLVDIPHGMMTRVLQHAKLIEQNKTRLVLAPAPTKLKKHS